MDIENCNQPLTAAYSWGGDSTAGMLNQEAGYVNSIAQVGGARRSRTTKRSKRSKRSTKRSTKRSRRSRSTKRSTRKTRKNRNKRR